MFILGIVLAALGGLGLFYQGFTFVTRKKVLDLGPISVNADSPTTVWVPPILATSMMIGGVLLLMMAS